MTAVSRVRTRATLLVALAACLIPALAVFAAPGPGGSSEAGPGGTDPPAAHLPPPTGSTSRVSVSAKGAQAAAYSYQSALSADGRWVAFTSLAGNLVGGDNNGAPEVFVKDLQTGGVERLPLLKGAFVASGGQADQPSISGNGEFVAFRYAPPPVASAVSLPSQSRIYLWQRGKGTIELPRIQGYAAEIRSEPSISPDGSWVAFTVVGYASSTSTQPLPSQVFAWNRANGQLVLVSADIRGGPGNAQSNRPSISNGGAFVAFQSLATTLVTRDPNPGRDVFLRDQSARTTVMVDTPPAVPPGATGAPSWSNVDPAVSADGRYVAFTTNIRQVARDANSTNDVYRWSRETRLYDLISVNAADSGAAGDSDQPTINADGRYVAFRAAAASIVTAPIPGAIPPDEARRREVPIPTEVYLRDLSVPETIRISVTADGASAGPSQEPSVANDGGRVTFDSPAVNLVGGDTNQANDVFLRDHPPIASAVPNPLAFGSVPVGLESLPAAVIVGSDGWPDLRVTGVSIAGANAGDFRVVAEGCTAKPIPRFGKCPVTIAYKPTAPGSRAAELRIAFAGPGSPRTVRLTGTATDARLTIEPAVGPPGRVVQATGTNFPAGAAVKLSWLPGISPQLPPIVADAQGNFAAQVLVFHRDVLGSRVLRAEPAGTICFPAVEAPYLVVPGSGKPPTYPGSGAVPDPIIRPAGNLRAPTTFPSQPPCVPGSGPQAPVITPPPTLPPIVIPTPTPTPGVTPRPTPTPIPTPTPTPSPTLPPDTTPPTLSGLSANPDDLVHACGPLTTTISVTASDAVGVTLVRLWYDPPGATVGWSTKLLSLTSGTNKNGTWQTTVSIGAGWDQGPMLYYVVGSDARGNTRSLPAIPPYPAVGVFACVY
jgi:Tol biopolymer transport system component